MPIAPSSTGLIARTGNTDNTKDLAGGAFDAAWTPTSKKYQYWAIKLKPYFETQLKIQNKIYIDQIMQIDFSFDLESFKSYFWADVAMWYQYDSTDPQNPASSGYYTNYRNYFFCSDGGLTVKPILMSINLSIKLRNCYKTLIQSLTDWSNWTKIGLNTPYFGILDSCRASDSESVTVFSWNPIAQDFNYGLWGNTDNGNPQVDWDASDITTPVAGTDKYVFNYCWHVNANEYELNNGGDLGVLYCGAASPYDDGLITINAIDRTVAPASCT